MRWSLIDRPLRALLGFHALQALVVVAERDVLFEAALRLHEGKEESGGGGRHVAGAGAADAATPQKATVEERLPSEAAADADVNALNSSKAAARSSRSSGRKQPLKLHLGSDGAVLAASPAAKIESAVPATATKAVATVLAEVASDTAQTQTENASLAVAGARAKLDQNLTQIPGFGGGLSALAGGVDNAINVIKMTVKEYAKLNNGQCPKQGTINLPGVEPEYMIGTGCNFQGDTSLCKCEWSPLYECATKSYTGGQVTSGLTGTLVETFGYCRIAVWVYVVGFGVFPLLLLCLAYVACCRESGTQKEEKEDDDNDDEGDDEDD